MTDSADLAPPRQKRSFFATLELDTRLLGMIGAFILICAIFQLWTGARSVQDTVNPLTWLTEGRFLTPRNIFNLTIQTVSRGDHGHGHGLRDRHPQYRPVGGRAAGDLLGDDGDGPDSGDRPQWLGAGTGTSG
jgi:hypothetical protein